MPNQRTELARWLTKNGYETIPPMEFYRAMFPSGELAEYSDRPRSEEANQEWKYNAILLENTHKVKTVMRTNPRDGKKERSEKEIWKNYIVLDDLSRIEEAVNQYGETESEFFIAPMSYLGRKRTKKNERWIYACIVEVDHPKTEVVEDEDPVTGNITRHRIQRGMEQLIWDWTKSSIPYLMPTACVCSGSGLHLIYLLDRPYQIQDDYQKQQWDNFRTRFTHRVWNQYVTKAPIQYENHCQSFRVVGTRTKKGQLVEAFWLSRKRYTIDELFGQVRYDKKPTWKNLDEFLKKEKEYNQGLYPPDDLMKISKEPMPKGEKALSPRMQAAKEQWPDWYQRRIVEKQPPKQQGQWTSHRGLYDWYLAKAKEGAYVGSRYHRVHALAEFAVKCGISFDEFKKDAYDLYTIFNQLNGADPFRYLEFVKARDEYFSEMAHKSTRKWVEEKTGIHFGIPAKRNGRSQQEHLQAPTLVNRETGRPMINSCKVNRDMTLQYMRENGQIHGRPPGSNSKREAIKAWRADNPGGTKMECHRATGISRPTIDKWWKTA